MPLFVDFMSGVFLFLGSFICFSGGIGVFRFPDFYTRVHAAAVTDLGAGLMLLGLMLQAGWSLVLAKLIMVLLFVLISSPVASHALAKAALHSGLKPVTFKRRTENKGS